MLVNEGRWMMMPRWRKYHREKSPHSKAALCGVRLRYSRDYGGRPRQGAMCRTCRAIHYKEESDGG